MIKYGQVCVTRLPSTVLSTRTDASTSAKAQHGGMNAQGIPRRPGAPHRCPGCRTVLAVSARACPKCGLGLVGPTAQRLWWIDAELASLDLRRHTLLEERPGVLARLREETHAAERVATPSAPTAPVPAPVAPAPRPAAPTREVSRRSAQNVILGLGALLIAIAALVFAVWTWSDLGTGARTTVLGLTTLTVYFLIFC